MIECILFKRLAYCTQTNPPSLPTSPSPVGPLHASRGLSVHRQLYPWSWMLGHALCDIPGWYYAVFRPDHNLLVRFVLNDDVGGQR